MRVKGPKVCIEPQGVQALGLVLHELATNALKYGALSKDGGVVHVSWEVTPGPMLEVIWRETGGPVIDAPPSHEGFGAVMLRDVLVKQFNGRLTFDWRREGLSAAFTIPPPAFHEELASADSAKPTPSSTGSKTS
jgi:two-component sensor histidine kinase